MKCLCKLLNTFLFLSIFSLSLISAYYRPITKQPFRPQRSTTIRQRLFSSPIAGSKIQKQVFSCQKPRETLPHPDNPYMYKICIPAGKNWITYAYQCPTQTIFDQNSSRCVIKPLTTTTKTAITTPTTIPAVPFLTDGSATTDSTTIESSKNPSSGAEMSTTKMGNELTSTYPSTDSLSSSLSSSSSSSEEIYLTHPRHFTNSLPPKNVLYTPSPPVNKIELPHLYPTRSQYNEQSQHPYATQKLDESQNDSYKLTTWQALAKISTATHTPTYATYSAASSTAFTNPVDSISPMVNNWDEKPLENFIWEANQVTNAPETRWKPSTTSYHRERFPGLRPSSH